MPWRGSWRWSIASQNYPGYCPLADKAQLISYRQMLGVAYERLRELRVVGQIFEEAVAAKPLADLEDRWIEVVYAGVY